MMASRILLLFFSAAALSLATADSAPALPTQVTGINDNGTVSGTYSFWVNGNTAAVRGFTFDGSVFSDVASPAPDGQVTTVWGINNFGAVTGTYFTGAGLHSFISQGGVVELVVNPLAPTSTQIRGINDARDNVGSYPGPGLGESLGYADIGGVFSSIQYPGALQTDLFDINNLGVVLGVNSAANRLNSFIYQNGIFTDLDQSLHPENMQYNGLNDIGGYVGHYNDDTGGHGFMYVNGEFTTLDVPGATATLATAINNSGVVAGFYFDGPNGNEEHGFTYASGVFTTIDNPAALRPSPVPEPASWILMIAGFSLLGEVLRRRRGGGPSYRTPRHTIREPSLPQ